jgi:hypothetical protein
VAGSVGAGSGKWLLGLVEIALSLGLNFILFMLAFRILTDRGPVMGKCQARRHRRRRRVGDPAGGRRGTT